MLPSSNAMLGPQYGHFFTSAKRNSGCTARSCEMNETMKFAAKVGHMSFNKRGKKKKLSKRVGFGLDDEEDADDGPLRRRIGLGRNPVPDEGLPAGKPTKSTKKRARRMHFGTQKADYDRSSTKSILNSEPPPVEADVQVPDPGQHLPSSAPASSAAERITIVSGLPDSDEEDDALQQAEMKRLADAARQQRAVARQQAMEDEEEYIPLEASVKQAESRQHNPPSLPSSSASVAALGQRLFGGTGIAGEGAREGSVPPSDGPSAAGRKRSRHSSHRSAMERWEQEAMERGGGTRHASSPSQGGSNSNRLGRASGAAASAADPGGAAAGGPLTWRSIDSVPAMQPSDAAVFPGSEQGVQLAGRSAEPAGHRAVKALGLEAVLAARRATDQGGEGGTKGGGDGANDGNATDLIPGNAPGNTDGIPHHEVLRQLGLEEEDWAALDAVARRIEASREQGIRDRDTASQQMEGLQLEIEEAERAAQAAEL